MPWTRSPTWSTWKRKWDWRGSSPRLSWTSTRWVETTEGVEAVYHVCFTWSPSRDSTSRPSVNLSCFTWRLSGSQFVLIQLKVLWILSQFVLLQQTMCVCLVSTEGRVERNQFVLILLKSLTESVCLVSVKVTQEIKRVCLVSVEDPAPTHPADVQAVCSVVRGGMCVPLLWDALQGVALRPGAAQVCPGGE